jgi:UDP-N-acetylglucosamine 2-epimerase (non-hydrolysing)
VEAGLRSFNMKMPEEKNRILTDHIADLLFTTEESANKNLAREGIPMEKIKFVGNVMIDSLKKHKKHAMKSKILEKIGVRKGKYVVLTMHRPENTDHKDILKGIIDALDEIQEKIDLVWPLHPRAKKQLIKFGLFNRIKKMKNLHLIDSQGYFDFMKLMIGAKFVITDSGGVQEETTMLGVGCITIRNETERPITVKQGTNIIAGNGKKGILRKVNAALKKKRWKVRVPKYWDGRASKRIIAEILKPKKSQKC